jgi:hypothetical protein
MRMPLAAAAAGLAACGYVYAVDPSEPGHFPPCPTKVLTGWDCPFCGSLRATHEVLHGNVGGALDLNAVTVLFVLPVALVVLGAWTLKRWRGEQFEMRVPTWATGAVVALMVVFTVVRNLPGMPLGTSA